MSAYNRREFVSFMGGIMATGLFSSCDRSGRGSYIGSVAKQDTLSPKVSDDLRLVDGLDYEVLLEWGQPIGKDAEFGFNNDYLAVLPTGKSDESWLWVNHEYTNPIFVSPEMKNGIPNKDQVIQQMASVGGSIVKIKRNLKTGRWMFLPGSGTRLNAMTKIPFVGGKIKGSDHAIGTMGNCAGGYTPWRTFLSCEENIDVYYGDVDSKGKSLTDASLGWEKFYQYPPEHYGWVVEIEPETAKAKKLVALGRFAHESCTVVPLSDGRVVAYTGDDKENEHLYRFVSSKAHSLEEGELFVADIKNGKWLSLSYEKQPILRKHFKDQVEVLTFCREAAKLVGATALDRPEDIEVHPKTGDVYVSLTNNVENMNFHGSIMRLSPKGGHHLSEEFVAQDFLIGGDDAGFSCPDNLVFDRKGNLWFTTDVSGKAIGLPPYTNFGNNGLFYVALSGDDVGNVHRMVEAPTEAELTGPCFTPDGMGLFICVQHPGEMSESHTSPSSHWPRGGNEMPRPAVVELRGQLLDKLLG